ncbi:MAG: hypothetical protein ACRDRP_20630, partial [Pseudonocardiaceae bacterium]
DGLGQVAGRARRAGRAAAGPEMAGSPDISDLPPMRKLLVSPGRIRPDLRELPQEITATTRRRSGRKINAPGVVRYCRMP